MMYLNFAFFYFSAELLFALVLLRTFKECIIFSIIPLFFIFFFTEKSVTI